MEHLLHHTPGTNVQSSPLSLEEQREDFKKNRFIAMPLAGTIVWALLGISAPFVSELTITWMLYIGTGAIFYLGAGLSYLTGERFFAKSVVRWHDHEPNGICHCASRCSHRPHHRSIEYWHSRRPDVDAFIMGYRTLDRLLSHANQNLRHCRRLVLVSRCTGRGNIGCDCRCLHCVINHP